MNDEFDVAGVTAPASQVRPTVGVEGFQSMTQTEHGTSHVVLCGNAESSVLRDLLSQFGYRVTEYLHDDIPLGQSLKDVEAIIVPASPQNLSAVFSMVRRINEWRFVQTTIPLAPEVIMIAAPSVPTSTILDLREQFCRVIHDSQSELFRELRILAVERERLLSRGVLLLFFEEPGSVLRVFLVGRDGRQAEMELNPRENRILRKLSSARQTLSRFDLAAAAGCKPNQVRVYIERIKAEFEKQKKEAGLPVSNDQFIRSPGSGWQLKARIKRI